MFLKSTHLSFPNTPIYSFNLIFEILNLEIFLKIIAVRRRRVFRYDFVTSLVSESELLIMEGRRSL